MGLMWVELRRIFDHLPTLLSIEGQCEVIILHNGQELSQTIDPVLLWIITVV